MANKTKGEVSLSHQGASYTLAFDFNALAEFEDVAGVENALAVLQNPKGMGVRHTRALFWCGLKAHHPDLTLIEAGEILTANADKLGEALLAAFPQGDEGNVKPAKPARR